MATTKEGLRISARELGVRHGKQLIKKLTRAELERIARRKPLNVYEEAKIKVIKEFLEKEEKEKSKKRGGRKSTKRKRGRTVKVKRHQTGRSKNLSRDKKLKALPPGKRISASGKVYYEYRQNRSDLSGGI